jgi:phosphoglycerate dehydrogenase-like enzyme
VTLAFDKEMGQKAKKLRLVQVPGAGLDRIDRAAIPAGASLANVYAHEAGIGEFMKRTAILVNIARGAVIDEGALYTLLREGRIGGAAIDVWYAYPSARGIIRPSTCPFHELDNVLMTPHISGWIDGMLEARCSLIAENIERFRKV